MRCVRRGNVVQYNAEGIVGGEDSEALCSLPTMFIPENDVILSRGGSPEMKIVIFGTGTLRSSGNASNGIAFWNSAAGVAKS